MNNNSDSYKTLLTKINENKTKLSKLKMTTTVIDEHGNQMYTIDDVDYIKAPNDEFIIDKTNEIVYYNKDNNKV